MTPDELTALEEKNRAREACDCPRVAFDSGMSCMEHEDAADMRADIDTLLAEVKMARAILAEAGIVTERLPEGVRWRRWTGEVPFGD